MLRRRWGNGAIVQKMTEAGGVVHQGGAAAAAAISSVVDGEVGLHGAELVVLEGGPHAFGLRARAVLGVAVHGVPVILVTAQGCDTHTHTDTHTQLGCSF